MIAAALLTLALAAGAEALDVAVGPYRQAAQAREVGVVAGRVYEESRTPRGPVRPLASGRARGSALRHRRFPTSKLS